VSTPPKGHPSNRVTEENAGEVVRYHRPTPDQVARHEQLAAGAEQFIRTILTVAPDSADRSAAIRHVREAKMTASAAVALEPALPDPPADPNYRKG
jgi:hypothetical protein